jgi:hypothetical protein
VRITFPTGFSLCSYWETFTSNDLSSSFSFSIGTAEGFEDVVASSAMIGSLLIFMENNLKKKTNLILAFGNLMFLFWKLRWA